MTRAPALADTGREFMGNDIANRVLTMTGQGSPVLIALALLSVLALAIVLLKLYHFARVGLWSRRWTDEVLAAVGRGDGEAALASAKASPNPVARVLEVAIAGRIAHVVCCELLGCRGAAGQGALWVDCGVVTSCPLQS